MIKVTALEIERRFVQDFDETMRGEEFSSGSISIHLTHSNETGRLRLHS